MDNNFDYSHKKHNRFHIIYDKYNYLVKNIAERYLGREEALDVCQEAFLSLYLHYDLHLSDEELKALLIKLTSAKSIDFLRKQNRETKSSAALCLEGKIYGGYNNTIELAIIKKDFYYEIVEEIKNMKPEWSEILIFHIILQMPQYEVAEKMNIPITSLRVRLNRARTYLKAIYYDEMKKLL